MANRRDMLPSVPSTSTLRFFFFDAAQLGQ
jgi:hypothetical protein